ncbi:hypothetical protein KI655_06160 [Vibrio sp. D404a]|uniref:hypothetical protein n=1 Tax=unclassified Vibrio TaxID=2614977 RepID=UPI0025575A53|nr:MULTISPECIES: hypothetical protein [unclassified Vibrio]MDK9736881.1 hypothetical protein [Vibrio sp. D404a]MDK9795701.1 hypothetical protein [Vibrio sp. D449a]
MIKVIAPLLLAFSGYALSAGTSSTESSSAESLNSNSLNTNSPDVFDINSIQNLPIQSLSTQNVLTAPKQNHECQSIVCSNYTSFDTSSTSNDDNITVVSVPERNSNETLDAIGSALYIIGEIGFAENLSGPDYRNSSSNY